jgi:hypothetical protein
MYHLLELYAQPYDPAEPVVCLDEKSKQLLGQTRRPIAAIPGQIAKEDYEYKRAGTRNLFVAVEPKAGHREVQVTRRRTKPDFVEFVRYLALEVYAQARKVHLVLDNLNTHFRSSFEQVMGLEAAAAFLSRLEFHYTPQACQLAEHGRDRDWHLGSPVSKPSPRRGDPFADRSARLGATPQSRAPSD